MLDEWSVVIEKSIRDDGSLLFPERLSKEVLDKLRRSMGSYRFANQYQNEVIPDDEKVFRQEWLRYYDNTPHATYSFGFIDPAIGQKDHNDFTGIAIVDVDSHGNWYLRSAERYRLTPTQIVSKMFDICAQFKLKALGVEVVAYQQALLYILDEEMKRRKVILPVKGITRNSTSKQARILGLVPRFEWSKLYVKKGMTSFEDEYSTFPRGSHDDILDSLASIDELVHYPQEEKPKEIKQPNSMADPSYESWYLQRLQKEKMREE